MENNNINWYALSDEAVMKKIGSYIHDCRLQQNKTQQQVAEAAGINRSTLIQLEKGNGCALSSLVRVLRVLEQLHLLQNFQVQARISPLQLAKVEQSKRRRARNSGKEKRSEW